MDIRHHTLEAGEGMPLILLHGNGEDGSYFKRQIPCFSKNYHVIALDTRGHGQTPRGSAPFSLAQFAEDLKDFMDERGIEKAHILGFSDGGNIAILFALRYPGRVERLILNGANISPGGVKLAFQIPMLGEYLMASWAVRRSAGQDAEMVRKKALLGLMVHEPKIKPRELRGIPNRTLVIAGDNDVIRDSHTRLIYKYLPDARLEIIEGDHFIARRKAEEFNHIVETFLKE